MKSSSLIILKKATKQYFPVVMFITMHVQGNSKVQSLRPIDIEKYLHLVLFIML